MYLLAGSVSGSWVNKEQFKEWYVDIPSSGIVASTGAILRLVLPLLDFDTLLDFVTALAPLPPAAIGLPTPKRR